MTIYTFHVTDAVTGVPVAGAQCTISDVALGVTRLEGQGGLTDANGVCALDILYFTPRYWSVYKAGYVTARGSVPGTTINVQLQPTAGPVKYYVNINATGPATLNPAAGLYQVDANSTLVVTVTSVESGYFLSRWRVDDVDVPASGNSISVQITHDSFTIYAVIEAKYTVYVSPVTGVGGTTDPFGSFLVLPNAQITARAIPDSGYVLDHWIINGVPSGTANPITVTVSRDPFMVQCVFKSLPPAGKCTLLFIVKNSAGNRLSGASVSVDGANGLTDSLGGAWFYDLALKTYNWTVTLNGYRDATGQILCNEAKEYGIDVTMASTGEAPVDWDAPAEYKSGVYEWSLKFSITPIPFVSSWVADLQAGQQNDQENLNRIMAERGATGTATILSKSVSMHTNWYGSVDYFTIKYTVAFTGSIQPTTEAGLFAWIVLVPYIPAILSIISLIIIGLIIYNITSTIRMITGPDEYKPLKDGECASGWVWDDAKKLCVKKGIDMGQLILIGGGVIVAATVLPQMLEDKGKKKS